MRVPRDWHRATACGRRRNPMRVLLIEDETILAEQIADRKGNSQTSHSKHTERWSHQHRGFALDAFALR